MSHCILGDTNQSFKHIAGTCANKLSEGFRKLNISNNACTGGLTNLRKIINFCDDMESLDFSGLIFSERENKAIIKALLDKFKKDWGLNNNISELTWVKGI